MSFLDPLDSDAETSFCLFVSMSVKDQARVADYNSAKISGGLVVRDIGGPTYFQARML